MRTPDIARIIGWCLAFCVLASSFVPSTAADETALWSALRSGSAFAMMRHELAPGTGDPAHFDVNDCSTQRNLSDTGRKQAVESGARFRANGISAARLFSSAWCRCTETASLLNIGRVEVLTALNSFYQRPAQKAPLLTALRSWLAEDRSKIPLVLVTHQVTISALTGKYASSGEIVVVRRSRKGKFEVLGSL